MTSPTAAAAMRSRNLAPGFWKNPELARCDAHARLMFAALWGLADRAGRLEDRPDKIRAEAFPFEPEINPDALLWQLHGQGLALRYVAATGHRLIEVPAFGRFQRPYGHEPASLWPSVHDAGSTLRVSQSENPLSIGDEELRLSPVSCLLSPVSLLLAEEARSSQLSIEGIGPPLKDALKEKTATAENQTARVAASCPHEVVLRLWCEMLPAQPAPALPWKSSSTSGRYLRARWRDQAELHGWDTVGEGLKWFRALFAYIARSRFLTGHTGPRRAHEMPFEVTLEWLVKHEHWVKVLQGQYHDRGDGVMR